MALKPNNSKSSRNKNSGKTNDLNAQDIDSIQISLESDKSDRSKDLEVFDWDLVESAAEQSNGSGQETKPTTNNAANNESITDLSKNSAILEEIDSSEDVEDFPEDYPDYYSSEMNEYLVEHEAVNILKQREDTRGRLAIIYTIATFVMFILGFVVAVLDAAWRQVSIAETLGAILPLISGIFLGTLGFVLGYYFRKSEDEER